MAQAAERDIHPVLSAHRPHLIRNGREYDRVMKEASELAGPGRNRSVAQNEYCVLSATLIEAYERANVPPFRKLVPTNY